jgi:hypothetical protein
MSNNKQSIFNKANRIKVCKKLIRAYDKLDKEEYVYSYNPNKYYELSEYWNQVLLKLQKQ